MKKRLISISLITIILSLMIVPAVSAMSDVVIDETILEPKDPILAMVVAIGPGILAHGFGNFYAEDYTMGMLLFGLEVVSLVVISVGYVTYTSPDNFTEIGGNTDEASRGGLLTLVSGVALFAATYLVDIVTAGGAAEQYNKEHNLEFKLQQESSVPALMYSYTF